MAKNKVEIDVNVDDKGSTKKVALNSKKAGDGLDKAAKSAGTYDRNMKGAAQATANGTKEFSKMSQGMGGLVGVYATIAAQVFAVSAAFQFLKSAADVTNLIRGQEALGAATGVAYKSITASLKAATAGQLQYAEAAQAAAIGTAAGLSPDQLERLASAAKNTSLALGRDLTDSFNRLVRGVTKAEPELLDELGIILRLDTATKEYAQSLNKNVQDLSQFEKSQAIVNNVLGQAEAKFGKIAVIMNEDAVALNAFVASFDELINSVKTVLTGALSPVFSFLSENTKSLTIAFGLFAASILKLIVPSFDQMAASADEAISMQEDKLKSLRSSYDDTADSLRKLGASKDEALGIESKSGEDTYKAIGLDPAKMRTKKGQGAADFLTGGATSKAAQANADKVLKRAEAQIKKHGKVISGHLKGATAQQVADLRAGYNRKAGILKKYEVQHGGMWTKAKMHVKSYVTSARIQLLSLKKTATNVGKGISKAMSMAFRLAGFIGIITMLYELGKAAYEFFFPVSEQAKKAQEATDNFVESTKLLNEELEKTAEVRADLTLLTLQERVVQLGNAFTSANLKEKFAEFSELKKGTKGYDDARKELEGLITTLGKMSPAFQALAKNLDLDDLTSDLATELINMGIGFSQAAVDASKLTENLRAVKTELTRLAGGGKSVDPTIALRAGLATADKSLGGTITAMETDLAAQTAMRDDPKYMFRGDSVIDSLRTQEQTVRDDFAALRPAEQARQLEATKKKILEIQERQIEREEELIKKHADDQAELEGYINQKKYINALQKEFNAVSETTTAIAKASNDLAVQEAQAKTVGVTFAQKEANLAAKKLGYDKQVLKAVNDVVMAQAALNAAMAEDSGADETEKQARRDALAAAEANLGVTVATTNLSREQDAIAADRNARQEALLVMKQREFALEQGLLGIANDKKRAQGGLTGTFGTGRAAELAGLEEQRLNQALAVAREKAANAAARLKELQESTTPVGEGQMQSAVQEAQQAGAGVVAAQTDVDVFKARANAIINNVRAENELLELRTAGLSLNPAEQAYNDLLIQAKQQGVTLDEKQLQLLKEQAIAQVQLKTTLEGLEGIRNSIQSGLEGAFESLINGTKNFKQAFADMAKAILMDIAKMIAKQMALKALMAVGGFGFADGGVIPGGIGYANGGKVPGGFRAFANGGIVRQPTMGLIGEGKYDEAVVPLPNGQAIPVQMLGGTSQQNNVVVNVAVDQNGNATSSTKESNGLDATKMGGMIAKAVQKELQEQKRAGGILNPYGSA